MERSPETDPEEDCCCEPKALSSFESEELSVADGGCLNHPWWETVGSSWHTTCHRTNQEERVTATLCRMVAVPNWQEGRCGCSPGTLLLQHGPHCQYTQKVVSSHSENREFTTHVKMLSSFPGWLLPLKVELGIGDQTTKATLVLFFS